MSDIIEFKNVIICIAFSVIVPYLICSINPAIIASKIKSGKDIREMGSGNPGLTNTLRTMGRGAAAVVLLFDVLKGVVSIFAVSFFCQLLLPGINERVQPEMQFFVWLAAFSAVIGHCYPIYYKFKGGKAVLVTVSAFMVIDWLSALIMLSLFIIIVAVTRYVSLGSLIAASLSPVCIWFMGTYVREVPNVYISVIFSIAIVAVLIFKHTNNIQRLLAGTEKKLGGNKDG